MPGQPNTISFLKWIDLVLPYRLWLKRKYSTETSRIQTKLLPEAYDFQKALLGYRNKIKEVNQNPALANNPVLAKASLKKEFEDINTHLHNENTPYILAGAEAMAFLGHDVYTSYQAVDEFVYEGMSRMTGENLENIANLSSKVQSYEYNFWEGLPDAGISKVGGHIGEAYSASSLQNKGIDVEWAKESNQTGWDLLVNGHEMNVKTVADANSLSNHFNQYPDIPAIIPGDAANIPDSAINIGSEAGIEELNQALLEGKENLVVVDPSVSNHEIMEQTAEATDFLTGSIDIFDTYIPILTAGLSSAREFKLLNKGHTTILNAAKNIGLDVVGTGGGGTIGAGIGAAIGSIIPGAGTIVGGLLGGVAGAVFGRKGSDSIKNLPFKKAYEDYTQESKDFDFSKTSLLRSTNASIDEFKSAHSKSINQEKEKYKREIAKAADAMKLARKKQYKLSPGEMKLWKNKALIELESFITTLNSRIKERNKWKAVFNPDAEDFALYNASIASQRLKNELISFDVVGGHAVEKELISLFARIGVLKESVLEFIADRELDRYAKEVDFRNKIDSLIGDLVEKRHKAILEISEYITSKVKEVQNTLKEKSKLVLEKMELVTIEKKKLGLK